MKIQKLIDLFYRKNMMNRYLHVNKRKSNQNILVQHVINFMNKNRRKSSSTAFRKLDPS